MKTKEIISLVLALTIVLCTTGRRQRTTYAQTEMNNADALQMDDYREQTQQEQTQQEIEDPEPTEASPEVIPEKHIEASTSNDSADTIKVPDKTNQDGSAGNQGGEGPNTAGDTGNDAVTVTDPTDDGGQTKPSGDGGSVETIMDKYADFLEDGVGRLYPCQVSYIYLEGEEGYQTFSRGSDENQLIMESGCYNLAEKLGGETFIDDDWIIKKNPELIVKIVSSDVLGKNVESTEAAMEVCSTIRTRPGWDTTRAVVNGNILILSKELMNSDEGKLAAKLYISSTLYPSLFSSLDLSAMCHELLGEGGIYAYCSS